MVLLGDHVCLPVVIREADRPFATLGGRLVVDQLPFGAFTGTVIQLAPGIGTGAESKSHRAGGVGDELSVADRCPGKRRTASGVDVQALRAGVVRLGTLIRGEQLVAAAGLAVGRVDVGERRCDGGDGRSVCGSSLARNARYLRRSSDCTCGAGATVSVRHELQRSVSYTGAGGAAAPSDTAAPAASD